MAVFRGPVVVTPPHKLFVGFSELNPQHLLWLKRKLARGKRYERMRDRRLGGSSVGGRGREPTKCLHHRKPIPPPERVYEMRPWRIERDPITGKPIGSMVR